MTFDATSRNLSAKLNGCSCFATPNRTHMGLRQTDNAVVNASLTVLIQPLLLSIQFTDDEQFTIQLRV
jgi:hypothetical protein